MNFEPQKFFIGLIDFFSVWLPGAILAWLLKDPVAGFLLAGGRQPGDIEAWALFLFGSYLAGHFIFLIGSRLDTLFDRLKRGSPSGQIECLGKGRRRPGRLIREAGTALFRKQDRALRKALRIKKAYLDPLEASRAVNAFQWCKARLALEHPATLEIVHRFEADSKFFRSLFVLLLIVLPWQAALHWPPLIDRLGGLSEPGDVAGLVGLLLVAFALLAGTFWRFVDLRTKAIRQAYWLVIASEAGREGGPKAMVPRADGLTHAGGIVFRRASGGIEYLLVTAKKNPQRRVFPKGHIEAGESAREAAVREVLEEGRIWARILGRLDDAEFGGAGSKTKVRFYLMEYLAEEEPGRPWKHEWLLKPTDGDEPPRKSEWIPWNEDPPGDFPKESRAVLELARKCVRPE